MDEETQVIQENTGKRSWRELWQLPTLAAAVVLAARRHATHNVKGVALQRVKQRG